MNSVPTVFNNQLVDWGSGMVLLDHCMLSRVVVLNKNSAKTQNQQPKLSPKKTTKGNIKKVFFGPVALIFVDHSCFQHTHTEWFWSHVHDQHVFEFFPSMFVAIKLVRPTPVRTMSNTNFPCQWSFCFKQFFEHSGAVTYYSPWQGIQSWKLKGHHIRNCLFQRTSNIFQHHKSFHVVAQPFQPNVVPTWFWVCFGNGLQFSSLGISFVGVRGLQKLCCKGWFLRANRFRKWRLRILRMNKKTSFDIIGWWHGETHMFKWHISPCMHMFWICLELVCSQGAGRWHVSSSCNQSSSSLPSSITALHGNGSISMVHHRYLNRHGPSKATPEGLR